MRERKTIFIFVKEIFKKQMLTKLHAFAIFIFCLSTDVNLYYVSFTYQTLRYVCVHDGKIMFIIYFLLSYLRQTLYVRNITRYGSNHIVKGEHFT